MAVLALRVCLLYVTYSVHLLQLTFAHFCCNVCLSALLVGIDVQLVGLIKTLIDPENIMTETPTVSNSGQFQCCFDCVALRLVWKILYTSLSVAGLFPLVCLQQPCSVHWAYMYLLVCPS